MINLEPKYNLKFLTNAHNKSSSHKTDVLSGAVCGCFCCGQTFSPLEIREWIEEPNGGETAICPKCGIDAILSSALPINDKFFLDEMNRYWFH